MSWTLGECRLSFSKLPILSSWAEEMRLPISQGQEPWRWPANVFVLYGERVAAHRRGAGQSPTFAGKKPCPAIKSKETEKWSKEYARTEAEGTLEGEQIHKYLKEHWQTDNMPSLVSMLNQLAGWGWGESLPFYFWNKVSRNGWGAKNLAANLVQDSQEGAREIAQ